MRTCLLPWVAALDRTDAAVPVISEAYLAQLAMAFGVNPAATRGVLLAKVVGDAGQGRSGIADASFALDGGAAVRGPYFLDGTMAPAGRIVIATPDTSTLLTMPSREEPPDRHPNVTFTSKLDPDYQLIRVWIAEGAKQS